MLFRISLKISKFKQTLSNTRLHQIFFLLIYDLLAQKHDAGPFELLIYFGNLYNLFIYLFFNQTNLMHFINDERCNTRRNNLKSIYGN
jgi:hypothetical protein